uniref:Phosphoglycerate mutase n=2 Tax=Dunaliella tertiolecta TaxID=3047 RepID=A0A7S3QKG6_DUNTE|mmetsp:Transcript_29096/g.78382  ORF Transcript_29096/g.78382 Transcript_29096/m.78382 type:complete len:217 (+) Transcript_29096:39-689(+)
MAFDPTNCRNTYWLLRHGRSLANEQDLICSAMENGIKPEWRLAELGRQQATAAGQRFKAEVEKMPKPSGGLIFLTSPFSRTIDTATLAAAEVGITPDSKNFEVTELLRERYYGKVFELTKATSGYDVTWAGDEAENGDYVPGTDGETCNQVAARLTELFKACEERFSGAYIVLTAHGDVLSICQALVTPKAEIKEHFRKFPFANCELKKVIPPTMI